MSKRKFFLLTFGIWEALALLAFLVMYSAIAFLPSFLASGKVAISYAVFSRFFSTLAPYYVLVLLAAYLISLVASLSKIGSYIISFFLLVLYVIVGLLLFKTFQGGFNEASFLVAGFLSLIQMILFFASMGIIPVAFIRILNEKPKFTPSYFVVRGALFIVLCIFFILPAKSVLSENITNAQQENVKLNQTKQEHNFKQFDPTYLPKGVSGLDSERTEEVEKGALFSSEVMQNSVFKNASSSNYKRAYVYTGDWVAAQPVASFFITEVILKSSESSREFSSFDESELKNQKTYLDSTGHGEEFVYEVLSINNNPAIYVKSYGTEKLYYYPAESIRIEIYGTGYGRQQTYVPKSELLKTAQGMIEKQ